MSTSSQLIKRVENAVFHEPYMIPILFKDCKVKAGFIHSRLRRYVPHRVGIEFECFGEFANRYLKDKGFNWTRFEDFESYFGLIDFSQNNPIKSREGDSRYQSIDIQGGDQDCEEVRVSIIDYRQLSGLYNIMKEMAKYCTISPDCGIHIHIDLTKYDTTEKRKRAVNWFNHHMSEVESIFPKYTGTYNKRVAQMGKGSYVNLSSHGTVEFRIAPLTFDYEVLINWIVKCSKLVSRMVIECHLDKDIIKKVDDELIYINHNIFMDLPFENYSGYTNEYIARDERLRRDYLSALVYHLLDSEYRDQVGIDWYFSNDDIIIEFPNNRCVIIGIVEAFHAYLDGGMDRVLNQARTYHGARLRNRTSSNPPTNTSVDVNDGIDGTTLISGSMDAGVLASSSDPGTSLLDNYTTIHQNYWSA